MKLKFLLLLLSVVIVGCRVGGEADLEVDRLNDLDLSNSLMRDLPTRTPTTTGLTPTVLPTTSPTTSPTSTSTATQTLTTETTTNVMVYVRSNVELEFAAAIDWCVMFPGYSTANLPLPYSKYHKPPSLPSMSCWEVCLEVVEQFAQVTDVEDVLPCGREFKERNGD